MRPDGELVTVIIPAHNAERYIGAAIESALAQTYRPIEVIVVDDGSADSTGVVAAAYATRGVTVLAQRHSGAAAARNRGLQVARGDYIQYMDADDLIDRDCIALKMARTVWRPRCIVYGHVEPFSVAPADVVSRPGDAGDWQDPINLIADMYIEHKYFIPLCAYLITSEIVRLAGGWREDLSTSDDVEYMSRVLAHAACVRYVPDAVYHHRSVAGSLRAVTTAERAGSALRAYELAVGYLGQKYPGLFSEIAVAQGYFNTLIGAYPFSKPWEAEVLGKVRRLAGRRRLSSDAVGGPRMRVLARLIGWRFARRVGLTVGKVRERARSRQGTGPS